MTKKQTVRHFINLPDMTPSVLKQILKDAHKMKAEKYRHKQIFEGMSLAMIFDKPSTRTRMSFALAFKQLGGHAEVLNKGDIQLGHSENIHDTAKVMSRFVDAIMIRASDHAMVEELAKHATVPVINALTDESHPCQIMADLMTIEQHGKKLKGLNIVWLGDYNNVAKTFVQAAPIFGFNLTISVPKALKPNLKDIKVEIDPKKAVAGADVIVTDTWVSMGEGKKNIKMFEPYQVNPALMKLAKKNAIFMHCLPAHRGEEVTDAVMDSPQSVVFDEAENRLHAQKAVLAYCLQNAGVKIKSNKK